MKRTTTWILPALTLLIASACDDGGPGEPAEPQLDEQAVLSILGGGGIPGGSGVRPCPEGGELAVTSDGHVDVEGDTTTATFEATLEYRGCTHLVQGDPMISDGTVRYDGVQRLRRISDHQVEMLESVVHHEGRMRIRHRDYDRTCDIDLTHTFIADRDVVRISGMMCGEPMNTEVPRVVPEPRR